MKKTLIAVAAILVVVVVALFVAPAFIPVDTYREQIETAARDATGRELKINGDISLSLLPRLAVEAEEVTFANAPGASEPQMASIEKLAVQLQIWPLLQREVKLDRLVLIGPKISLEVDAQGRPNWAFEAPAGGDGAPSQSSSESRSTESSDDGASPGLSNIALGEVRLEGGQVSYRDAASGAAYTAEDINMDVNLPSLDSPLTADGGLVWNGKKVSLNLGADPLLAVPLPRLDVGVGRRDVARQGQHQGEGVLGGRQQIGGRRVDHQDAALGRRLDVDVVDADAGAADHPEPLARGEQIGGHLGAAAHHQGVVVADQLGQPVAFFARQLGDHVTGIAEHGEAGGL